MAKTPSSNQREDPLHLRHLHRHHHPHGLEPVPGDEPEDSARDEPRLCIRLHLELGNLEEFCHLEKKTDPAGCTSARARSGLDEENFKRGGSLAVADVERGPGSIELNEP